MTHSPRFTVYSVLPGGGFTLADFPDFAAANRHAMNHRLHPETGEDTTNVIAQRTVVSAAYVMPVGRRPHGASDGELKHALHVLADVGYDLQPPDETHLLVKHGFGARKVLGTYGSRQLADEEQRERQTQADRDFREGRVTYDVPRFEVESTGSRRVANRPGRKARDLHDMTEAEITRIIFPRNVHPGKPVGLRDVFSDTEIADLPNHPAWDEFSRSFKDWVWIAIDAISEDR